MEPMQLDNSLQSEYFHLHKTIEDFDSKAITIKAWSVTFGLAALAGAFASHAPTVLLVAASSSLLFWYLETMWKVFQLGYYDRVTQIEGHFGVGEKLSKPFQISSVWMTKWNNTSWAETLSMAFWPHVALPHAFVFVTGVLLFCFGHAEVVPK